MNDESLRTIWQNFYIQTNNQLFSGEQDQKKLYMYMYMVSISARLMSFLLVLYFFGRRIVTRNAVHVIQVVFTCTGILILTLIERFYVGQKLIYRDYIYFYVVHCIPTPIKVYLILFAKGKISSIHSCLGVFSTIQNN